MVSGAGCSLRGRLPAVPRGAIPQEGGYSRGEPDSGVWAGVCRSVLVFRESRLVYVQLPCLTVPSEGAERVTQTPKCHTTARLRCLGAALEMVLPCSTSLTCTGVWGITAGRQKWAQAYPSPSSHAYPPSTLISLASYPTPVSLQPFLLVSQPVLRAESEYTRRGFAGRREYKIPPTNHFGITVFPRPSAFCLTAVLCVSTPRVSPVLMSHVDTPVPVPHILFPFLASLAPHSIGLGHEFCVCLQVFHILPLKQDTTNSSLYDS